MHQHAHHHATSDGSDPVQLVVQGQLLVCKKTPAGSWVCCTEEGNQSCARGFTPASAAAIWERSQHLGE